MTDETKKFLAIAAAVVCLAVAGWVSYNTFFGEGGGGEATGDMALLCTTCGGFEIPISEFRDMMNKNAQNMMMPMMGPSMMAMECPKCHKKTCYVAQKCDKCKNIFVFGQAKDPQYPDRCPKCRFSQIEDMQKNPTR
jgi:hypothetical protein